MNVSEAMQRRQSVRAFLARPVDRALIERVLTTASRAASVRSARSRAGKGHPVDQDGRNAGRQMRPRVIGRDDPQQHVLQV